MYETLLQLEIKGINRIWARVIKNSFAPFFSGVFDYVIGNPPWVNWENLPEDYRNETMTLWTEHKLIKGSLSGAFKKDIAMLFVAVAVSRFLKEDGVLAFLLPFPLLKTQSAAGYRTLVANTCETEVVDEMVDLKPFENAINRPSIMVLRKGRTRFPINCTSWSKLDSAELTYDLSLEQVKRRTRRLRMILEPIEGKNKPESPWIMINKRLANEFRKVTGKSQYHAHSGVDTGLNGAFWVEIISKEPTGVFIKNLYDIGKQELPKIDVVIEEQSLYPLIRGRDVKKWMAKPSCHIVLLHCDNGDSLAENIVKRNFPRTYSYFLKFRRQLENRSTHKLMGRLNPFYSAYKIGKYTFSPYKVVWKEISGKISGKGQFIATVIPPSRGVTNYTRPIIPDHKLIFIPLENGNEAYFVCGILNSSIVSLIIASYTIETEIPTNIPQYVRIPKFDPSDKIHLEIAKLSRTAHKLASTNNECELKNIEQQIDKLSCQIYDLQLSILPTIQESLREIHS